VRRLISRRMRSSGLLTGMRITVPARPARTALVLAYGVTIRDKGTGSTSVGRPICTMSRELVLLAGRPYDLPGCAVSADP
jgi:hypothetical protein